MQDTNFKVTATIPQHSLRPYSWNVCVQNHKHSLCSDSCRQEFFLSSKHSTNGRENAEWIFESCDPGIFREIAENPQPVRERRSVRSQKQGDWKARASVPGQNSSKPTFCFWDFHLPPCHSRSALLAKGPRSWDGARSTPFTVMQCCVALVVERIDAPETHNGTSRRRHRRQLFAKFYSVTQIFWNYILKRRAILVLSYTENFNLTQFSKW